MDSKEPTLELFRASFLLGAAGDAIGYKKHHVEIQQNGQWEFNFDGLDIHKQAEALGGIENIVVDKHNWMVSDDTVMHIATAKAILKCSKKAGSKDFWNQLCKEYVKCWGDMNGRAPGNTCAKAIPYLKRGEQVPAVSGVSGCGAAMRNMCLGLLFHRPSHLPLLIETSLIAGKATHNNPAGFIGGIVSALFTSYAIQKVPILDWGWKFSSEVYPMVVEYLKTSSPQEYEFYEKHDLNYFIDHWNWLLKERNLDRIGATSATYPEGFKEKIEIREKYYADKKFAYKGWAGSSGHDSVMLAYDALVGCDGDWSKFARWGILHGGDNDSTGSIGGAWFGALYGFQGVPSGHYEGLEMKDTLEKLASKIFDASKSW